MTVQVVIVIAIILTYAGIGYFVTQGSAFGREPTNPVQDFIHWTFGFNQILFWLPFLVAWQVSGWLPIKQWQHYVSHETRMNAILDERFVEIDKEFPDADISYGIPSPRAYKAYGNAAFPITIEEYAEAP